MSRTTAKKLEHETIGERVRALRLEKGISQRDLAERAGIDHTYLCHLEAGRKITNPSTNRILVLAKALNVAPAELLPG